MPVRGHPVDLVADRVPAGFDPSCGEVRQYGQIVRLARDAKTAHNGGSKKMLMLDTWLSNPTVLTICLTGTAIFSILAGISWLTSATGRRPFHGSWLGPAPLIEDPVERAAHQAHWNTLAALFASIAAMGQALATLPQIHTILGPP
jgi:hypothetical protein